MNIPADLRYTKTHEWIKEENGVVTVGLSDFAQQELGDLVFVNLPQVGDAVTAGEAFGAKEWPCPPPSSRCRTAALRSSDATRRSLRH